MSAVRTTAKQEVEALLGHLPDDCSLEDIRNEGHAQFAFNLR